MAGKPSPLLNLPAELRIEIYRLLLESPGELPVDYADKYFSGRKYIDLDRPKLAALRTNEWLKRAMNPTGLGDQVLRVCRQTYHEALPILYANNNFFFQQGKVSATQWINSIGPGRHFLKHVHIQNADRVRLLGWNALPLRLQRTGLESLSLGAWLWCDLGPEIVNVRFAALVKQMHEKAVKKRNCTGSGPSRSDVLMFTSDEHFDRMGHVDRSCITIISLCNSTRPRSLRRYPTTMRLAWIRHSIWSLSNLQLLLD
ncbi:hypothetical protein CLAFUW4_13247 [Fulvia fulva]|uniref:Uncharacterized protein n=1 Tax=Passalora fulva TaxID=5499 RepID=A0A9Q8PJT0_PASFU|nr:uncharacterized protein CLAFUR5_13103 [Fulvia fulva]KAK4611944.1 hypothetical protein CLAFUR4_13252 [Fulvia fulva]KAK4612712.1 hypothetical protein CLAFUR0_13257 [Fulvia fulva]UJO23746.1 hypothetical protein CLAFUR5_13103 [Fulvia fulva]WPV21078.1 hypothetical protein CLAFUW4_13247 [Fulvia fulva]WPV36624.1 hypothetical protein CLAFUW7_13254 [Fulvia fulva]